MTTSTSQQAISATTEALDVRSIKSIQLSDGWHNVQNCEFTHFAVGEAHSPITPSKLYPTLRYRNNEGNIVYTPMKNVLSFSEEMQSNTAD